MHYLDDATILYAAGHNIVTYNLETRQQQFIQASTDSEGIVALAVTPSKRFLAVAERAQKGTVTIYDLQTLKRRKVLTSTDSSAKVATSHPEPERFSTPHSPVHTPMHTADM